jgi:hypothetical protein
MKSQNGSRFRSCHILVWATVGYGRLLGIGKCLGIQSSANSPTREPLPCLCHSEPVFLGEESAFAWLGDAARARAKQIPRAIKPRFGMTNVLVWATVGYRQMFGYSVVRKLSRTELLLTLSFRTRFLGEESAFAWLGDAGGTRAKQIPRAMKPRFGMTNAGCLPA